MGVGHVFTPASLDALLSQGSVLEMALETVGSTHTARIGEGGEEPLVAQVQSSGQPAVMSSW